MGHPALVADAAYQKPVTRLLVFAEVRLYREGMCGSFEARSGFVVAGAAATLDQALEMAAGAARPDIIIVDMGMRESLVAIRTLRERVPMVPLVAFGVAETEREILTCAELGAAGYVPCNASMEDLIARIQSVARGELLCTPRIAASLFRELETRRSGHAPALNVLVLTAREREVLVFIEAGLSNKEIADRLHIEVATVKNHVHNVLKKLHVGSRLQAVAQLGPRRAGDVHGSVHASASVI